MPKLWRKEAPGSSLADRQKQRKAREAQRSSLVAAMSNRAKRRDPQPERTATRLQRDFDAYLRALDNVPFYLEGNKECMQVTASYRSMLHAAVEVMNTGRAEVLLCWPSSSTSIAALVSLLALADVAAAPSIKVKKGGNPFEAAAAPAGVRVVHFPYARTTHAAAREIYIDRDFLGEMHIRHEVRRLAGGTDPALDDYHSVLGRVRTMMARENGGLDRTEFLHPVLDEIVPHGSPTGGCSANGSLLWRTKSRTDLKAHKRTGWADDPAKARFYLYSIHAADSVRQELRALEVGPDLFVLDLSKAGRGRLGKDWIVPAKESVEAFRSIYPETGILALTDDPWAFDAARFEVLGTHYSRRQGRSSVIPSSSRTIYTPTSAIIQSSGADFKEPWAGAVRVAADGFAGQVDQTLRRFRSIDHRVREAGDPRSSEAVRSVMGKLRRTACLPGSLSELSEFLVQAAGDAVAADYLAGYRIGSDLTTLKDSRSSAIQVAADDLTAIEAEAVALARSAEVATPMASLIEEAVEPALRSSSRSVFVFRNEMLADFAADRLCRRFPKLVHRLRNDLIRFTGQQGLSGVTNLPSSVRNQVKKAVIVAPTRETALEILARPWLPDELLFLADSDTLRFIARDAARLGSQLDSDELQRRMNLLASAAKERVERLGGHVVALEANIAPVDDVEFPFGSIVDLAGPRGAFDTLLELRMQNGQRIIARPGTGIVRREGSRFVEVEAKDISEGDEVCVLSAAFIESARSLLNISAAAADEIRDYHEQVAKRFAALPGDSVVGRLRALTAAMGDPPVGIDTARYWIDLEDEFRKPLHEVVPHAPHDHATFIRFTGALGIGPRVAERFWAWAVIAQRSNRVRAGAAFHDAYKGILTDPHAAVAANNERAADIRALRKVAEEYVATVEAIRPLGGT